MNSQRSRQHVLDLHKACTDGTLELKGKGKQSPSLVRKLSSRYKHLKMKTQFPPKKSNWEDKALLRVGACPAVDGQQKKGFTAVSLQVHCLTVSCQCSSFSSFILSHYLYFCYIFLSFYPTCPLHVYYGFQCFSFMEFPSV